MPFLPVFLLPALLGASSLATSPVSPSSELCRQFVRETNALGLRVPADPDSAPPAAVDNWAVALPGTVDSVGIYVRQLPSDQARIYVLIRSHWWVCGNRSVGWGLRLSDNAATQWNHLMEQAERRTLIHDGQTAQAVGLLWLNFATAEPIALPPTAQGADLLSVHVATNHQPTFGVIRAVAVAVYPDSDGWFVNGRLELGDGYEFVSHFDSFGRVREPRLSYRPPR